MLYFTSDRKRDGEENRRYDDRELPTDDTIGNILNRMGYTLKRVMKAEPLKEIPGTDAIFGNVREADSASDADPESLRISVDSKAKARIGDFSRNGEPGIRQAEKEGNQTCRQSV